jgi:hypothetical protein
MFRNQISKWFAVALITMSVVVLPAVQGFAQHHPSWNQSFGQDSRTVDHQKTAMNFSKMLPGTGEWYNRNFEGGFPWGECILGYICSGVTEKVNACQVLIVLVVAPQCVTVVEASAKADCVILGFREKLQSVPPGARTA